MKQLYLIHGAYNDMQGPSRLERTLHAIEPDHIILDETEESVQFLRDTVRPAKARNAMRFLGQLNERTIRALQQFYRKNHGYESIVPYEFGMKTGTPIRFVGSDDVIPIRQRKIEKAYIAQELWTAQSLLLDPGYDRDREVQDTPRPKWKVHEKEQVWRRGLARNIKEAYLASNGKVVFSCPTVESQHSPDMQTLYEHLKNLNPTRVYIDEIDKKRVNMGGDLKIKRTPVSE